MPGVNLTQALAAEYLELFRTMEINQNRFDDVDLIVAKVVANKQIYEDVSTGLQIPWFFVAAMHNLESGLRFDRHLHNGDPLTARTRHVPAVRPADGDPPGQVYTSLSEVSGLTVTDNDGKSQRVIAESMGVRTVVSPGAEWIIVEDMQQSNLVIIRAFHYSDNGYHEVFLPETRQQWDVIAQEAGMSMEDLTNTRVGIEEFGPLGNTVSLRFRADAGKGNGPDLVSVIEVNLDQHKED